MLCDERENIAFHIGSDRTMRQIWLPPCKQVIEDAAGLDGSPRGLGRTPTEWKIRILHSDRHEFSGHAISYHQQFAMRVDLCCVSFC